METKKKEFKKLSGIDLTDHEVSGVFPFYKNGKWSSISRGKAWQMYSNWLEDETTSQQQTIERLRDAIDKFLIAWDSVPDFAVRKGVLQLRTEYEKVVNTTEPIDQ